MKTSKEWMTRKVWQSDQEMADFIAAIQSDARTGTADAKCMYPIQDGPSVPWSVMAPHESMCKKNHGGQSLERMAERGGLGCAEAWRVINGIDWPEKVISSHEAKAKWIAYAERINTGMVDVKELEPTIELITKLVSHYYEPQIAHYRMKKELTRLETLLKSATPEEK